MLRTPSACAPRSSDSSAIRFRSRVVKWTRHSRSMSCWMPKATAMAPIRTRAIALSLMLTRSTPASWSTAAASIVRSMRTERGGSISTLMTKRPSASRWARRVGGGGHRTRRSSARRGRRVAWRRWPGGAWWRPWPGRRRGDGVAVAARCRQLVPRHGRAPGASPRCTRAWCRSSRRRWPRRRGRTRSTTSPKYAGAGGVHELALDPLRQAGVGHDRARHAGRRGSHLRQRVQADDADRRRS